MLHRPSIVPVRMHRFDERLRCDTLQIVGYRFVCTCSGRGKVRRTVRLARADMREHREGVAALD